MSRMLMFMHHVALCTPYIALVNGGHLLHMRVDHVKPKSEISSVVSAQRVWWSTSIK
jgi:hypothetical protein